MATPTLSPRPQYLLGHLHASGSGEMPFSRPQTPHKELKLGYCGLGAMGYIMARNLATRLSHPTVQHPIVVYNRTRARAEKLAKEVGESEIKIANSPEELAIECDIIFTNLADDEVVKMFFEKFASALKVHHTIAVCSGSN